MLLSQKDYNSAKAQMMVRIFQQYFLLRYMLFSFRHNAIAHNRFWYSVNITLYALGSQKIHMTCFIATITFLWWSGTEPVPSLRCAHITMS